jgi:protein-S-isoprenylcysteine O-methyltransferase Ste14
MFSRIGEGTLAPWAPTKHIVVTGLYRHVRNPMISGVLIALLGEAILFSSFSIFLWFILASIVNHVYFIKSEEPGLLARFGDEYRVYWENVPRWIPRRTPWYPEYNQEDD